MNRIIYYSTKTYDHNIGLSACFRQWRATSHCRFLHGYALAFSFVFATHTRDDRNWVVDFGSLAPLKEALQARFDHKLLIAEDDPQKDHLCALAGRGCAETVLLPAVGCEAFAEQAYAMAWNVLDRAGIKDRVWVHEVECREHSANSAIFGR